MDYDAIVLAGGRARRFGGIDKTALRFNGATLLETALYAVRGARSIVVVGPARPGHEDVDWIIEDPPGTGPAHALAAGLGVGSAPIVVLLGADFPFVTAPVIGRLRAALEEGADGAVATDASGRDQFLLAAYRRRALAAALRSLPTEDAPLARVVESLHLVRKREETAAFDCDTWVDVATARRFGQREVWRDA